MFFKKENINVSLILVIAELILKNLIKVIRNEILVKVLRKFQKSVFYLLPHMSYFNGNAAFSLVAAQNARCRNMPNNLMYVACTQGDECCGKLQKLFFRKTDLIFEL